MNFVPQNGSAKTLKQVKLRTEASSVKGDATVSGTCALGQIIPFIGFVTDGENVLGSSKWFKTSDGNYFWSGNVEVLPTISAEIPSNKFLSIPIQGVDASGNGLTPRTAKISGVIDHSDTAIDPSSTKRWGLHAKDQKVRAFNGEMGDGEASATAPLGYTKKPATPFFSAREINYVGAHGAGDKYGATCYLNYDGHAGYDFPYAQTTPILAAADGTLQKAANTDDLIYGQGWPVHHTFYIKHANGFSTWYRHCTKLENSIEAKILSDYTKSCTVKQGDVIAYVGSFGAGGAVHLHFEVRDPKGKIVDPYGDGLWLE